MIRNIFNTLFPAPKVYAHCDGPCGVYDPASVRIAAEAQVSYSMTQKNCCYGYTRSSLTKLHILRSTTISIVTLL